MMWIIVIQFRDLSITIHIVSTDFIHNLKKRGFFARVVAQGQSVLQFKSPLKVIIPASVVEDLQDCYLPHEEIGGIFWTQARELSSEKVLIVKRVQYFRNAIGDAVRQDGRTKRDAFLPDQSEFSRGVKDTFEAGCFPLRFHTHPNHGNDTGSQIMYRLRQMETSKQDHVASEYVFKWGDHNLHMPSLLVVGDTLSNELFIGVYGGGVSPLEFGDSKHEVMRKNINSMGDRLKNVKLTTSQKFLAGAAGIAAIAAIIWKPKVSVGILFAGAPLSALLLENTFEPAAHYCRIRKGEATILIPK
jgi:hypothetical protein